MDPLALASLLLHDGGQNITSDALSKVLKAAKVNVDAKILNLYGSTLSDNATGVTELLEATSTVGGGSGGAVAAAPVADAAGGGNAKAEAKKPEPESESDDDMGMDLFG